MKLFSAYILPAAMLLCSLWLQAQQQRPEKREKFPSYFGLQIKPLIPGDFLGTSQTVVSNSGLTGTFTQRPGYSFGASVRIGLTKLISLETGINQVQRRYDIDFAIPDSNLYASNSFGIINYDVPFNALVYIQLGRQLFMNTSMGASVVYNPSDVATTVYPGGPHIFKHEGRRISKVAIELNANIGFEWRTEKSGTFYLGASGRVPLRPIFDVAAVYQRQGETTKIVAIGSMIGTYLSFDIRYYLPNIRNKGVQFHNGPIEQ